MKKDLMLLIIDRVNVMDQVRAISQDSSLEPDSDRFSSDIDKEAIRLFSRYGVEVTSDADSRRNMIELFSNDSRAGAGVFAPEELIFDPDWTFPDFIPPLL